MTDEKKTTSNLTKGIEVLKIQRRYRLKRLMEHLMGPIGSILFHVVVVFCLIRFMVYKPADKRAEFEVVVMEADAVELDEFQEEFEKIEEMEDLSDIDAPLDSAINDIQAPPNVDNTAVGPAQDANTDMAALDVRNDARSSLVMKGLYAGRSSGGRSGSLAMFAGKYGMYTESAVIKALEWLKNHQAADGSWGPNKSPMTGLAILAFLAHGETTSSEKYGQTVEKGIRFLVSQQNDAGEFLNVKNNDGPYAQAIATYAISEAYGLTRIPSLKPVMEKAISVILAGQQVKGGWDYAYERASRRDTSIAGWQIQALKSAYIGGSSNQGLKPALEKAIEDLKSVQDSATGRFYYTDTSSHQTDTITAIGALSLELLGHSKDKECRQALDALRGSDCDWTKPPPWALYGWYYITQAKFHSGGPAWTAWNAKFAKEYTRNQNEDGSWTSPSGQLQEGKETNNGPVYSTALAALTLQVYYRFLPTYKPIAVESGDETDEGDISVQVI
ncbi:MAG: prenyltransferase/squalene oxidase repeat-containing protein [bacterium]